MARSLSVKAAGGVVYEAFGTRFRCPWPIPCPPPTSDRPAAIEFLESPEAFAGLDVAGSTGVPRHRRLGNGSTYLRWDGYHEFLIPDRPTAGDPIRFSRLERGTCETFAAYFLGQVLSFPLLRAGKESLHATTIVAGGRAVGFLGDCGHGKSTLGAAFLAAGDPVLSDDLLVLEEAGGRFVAHPGIPRIKVSPDVGRRLLLASRFPAGGRPGKAIVPLEAGEYHARPAPLATLYVIDPSVGPGAPIRVDPLGDREAFLSVLVNTFNSLVDDRERLAGQFRFVERLVRAVPIRRLIYPRRLESLPEVLAVVRSDGPS